MLASETMAGRMIFTGHFYKAGSSRSQSGKRGCADTRFWMYFMPQPSKDRGELDGSLSLADLTDRIKVRLCSESGKELVKLPITQRIQPIESLRAGNGSDPRGRRSVLIVHDNHFPNLREYQMMTGLTEDVWVLSTARDRARDCRTA